MHPWKAREVSIGFSGEARQWCLDDGEGDLIPCGSGEPGKQRAEKLSETLNLGSVYAATNKNLKPLLDSAVAVYEMCHSFELLIMQTFPPPVQSSSQIKPLITLLGKLNNEASRFQQLLLK